MISINAYEIVFLEHDYSKEPIQYYDITFKTIVPIVLYMVLHTYEYCLN